MHNSKVLTVDYLPLKNTTPKFVVPKKIEMLLYGIDINLL